MSEHLKGHLAMMLFASLVAGSFSLGALASPFIDPVSLNAVRFILGAVLLWTMALATGGVTRDVFHAPWRYLVLAGLFAIYFVTMFEGLKTAEPVSMAAVFTLNPALTAVFGYFLLRQITTARMALAIVIGGIGALWVIFKADISALLRFEIGRGEAIYFWGCIAHALYSPMLRKLSRGEPALAFNAGVLTAGALILLVLAGPRVLSVDWASLPAIVWITILYVAVLATSVTFMCLRYATLRLPSAKVMAYTYIVPSWVILWEVAFGHGVPSALILPGVVLTAVSLLLLLKDEEAGAVA
ncbi:DMT family transporter [Tropicibacter naphthalenivorans]|uniref:Carboxylate/amino acid/amine transporter n=1 Tax=Tropicibacter naphthalenivorans TaxID=441103 RepID=A0A0P1FZI4_9RHOB|nr:DMT family transporter [Tropicibacter naphthalenivorans]CUH74829.1 carboxylate/amino acid/amine transporter [Tropicibacter naphthalenivorans]SMC48722.1 EamA-like transporter family protein [Tropicibacter naphthalenivorans]